MNKERLLKYAKGEAAQPRIIVTLERDIKGAVYVVSANIVENAETDIIFQSCLNGGTNEFWSNYNSIAIIEEVRQLLIHKRL